MLQFRLVGASEVYGYVGDLLDVIVCKDILKVVSLGRGNFEAYGCVITRLS